MVKHPSIAQQAHSQYVAYYPTYSRHLSESLWQRWRREQLGDDGLYPQGSAWDTDPSSRTAGTWHRESTKIWHEKPGEYFECTRKTSTKITSKQASMAKIIYMAWHRYEKVIASPSLTVGLNLPLTFERSHLSGRNEYLVSHLVTTQHLTTQCIFDFILMPLATQA